MKKFLPAILLLLCASPAFAWNCSDPLASRVPVPAGTAGSFGNGDGQLFLGTGTEGVKGQLYECKVPTPTPKDLKTTGAPVYQNQTQSQNNSQNTSVNSTQNTSNQNSSSSGSSSKSSSSANSTNNNANSNSNTNLVSPTATSTSTGGTSNASSSNNSTGNTSTYDSNTTVDAAKIPVATALAVAPPATSPCVVGFGAGVQTMAFGGSLSGGKIDKNCAILETARSFASMNARLAYCKTMLIDKYAKKAGITLEDCMTVPVVAVVPQPAVAQPQPIPIIIQAPPVPVPTPVAPEPVVRSTGSLQDLGSFKVTRSYSTNLCPTVQTILGPGGVQILNRAVTLAANGEVILIGNVYTTAVATSYLRKHGVSKVTIRAADEQDNSVAVQIWTVN